MVRRMDPDIVKDELEQCAARAVELAARMGADQFEAAASYERAIACQTKAADRAPQVVQFRDLLSMHQDNHTRVQRKLDQG